MPGKCHKTVYTGRGHARHWSNWPDILSKVVSGSLLFSPVCGGSRHSPVPDKHLLFPVVLDKAEHKAVDLLLSLQAAPDSFLICKPFHFSYGVAGAAQRSGDLCDVVPKALEPQDFAIIYHDHRPP